MRPTITDADIARGKADLKAAVLYAGDNASARQEGIAQQALIKKSVSSPGAIVAEIEKITAADVKSVSIESLNLFFFFVDLSRFRYIQKSE